MSPYAVLLTVGGWTLDRPIEVEADTPAGAAAEAVRRGWPSGPPGPVERAVVTWAQVFGAGPRWTRSAELVAVPGGDPATPGGWRSAPVVAGERCPGCGMVHPTRSERCAGGALWGPPAEIRAPWGTYVLREGVSS